MIINHVIVVNNYILLIMASVIDRKPVNAEIVFVTYTITIAQFPKLKSGPD